MSWLKVFFFLKNTETGSSSFSLIEVILIFQLNKNVGLLDFPVMVG